MKHLISVPSNTIAYFHQISGLPEADWFVSADPDGKRVGSGGGTAHLLTETFSSEAESNFEEWLRKEKRVIIHAGGQSRRLPAYAPMGKSLLPMPVFRWSRGQQLNQRLIHLQTPLFDEILERAPGSLNTLIASGDTLIFSGKKIPEIPEADVVCFGMWIEPEKAANHGVFFTRHESPGNLQFMMQKPSTQKIKELIHQYYFLMDIGIWLLSEKAIGILLNRCGWNGSSYRNQTPDFYDLYSDFGMALGNSPEMKDPEINNLKVVLINMEGGDFYHLGNTSELISSNLAIQNRINDQREIWHRQIKPHSSMFVLNSEFEIELEPENTNIWIENSFIPKGWNLQSNHALTNIPQNNWSIKLNKGVCLDLVPVSEDELIIRHYGFNDDFKGDLNKETTRFMDQSLKNWLVKRDLSDSFKDIPGSTDIQFLKLFLVIKKENLKVDFLQWLIDLDPDFSPGYSQIWIKSKRVSADEISRISNILLIEKQSTANRMKAIPVIAKNYSNSVFYQLDLEKLANEYVSENLELPDAISENNNWLPIHSHMFRATVKRRKGLDWENEEKNAFNYLRDAVLEHFQENLVEPTINLLPDQIAWGRSPVRLDLAGGWTDTPPYCFLYGGKVVNLAVELNGQPPLHCYVKASDKPEFVLRSIDLGAQETVTTYEELKAFHNVGSPFAIPKAALALSGFLPEFSLQKFSSLKEQLTEAGGGLEISILSAVPKGSGLGTSSILAATVLGTLSEVCGLGWDKTETGRRTLALEQLLTTGGGWQDQFGGILEGIKLLETASGKIQSPAIKWLPDSLFTDPRFKNKMLLYYTGITRVAKSILADIVRGMFLNSAPHLALLEELKNHAEITSESISSKDYEGLGRNILRNWELNQSLDSGTNTSETQKIIDLIEPYSAGHKLLGAGGGGFMLILSKDEKAADLIRQELSAHPINNRARFVDFCISNTGLQVTKS
jgi:galactokinase/mevalonate kinase-like predicted kinase